jgi:hypothetical protein
VTLSRPRKPRVVATKGVMTLPISAVDHYGRRAARTPLPLLKQEGIRHVPVLMVVAHWCRHRRQHDQQTVGTLCLDTPVLAAGSYKTFTSLHERHVMDIAHVLDHEGRRRSRTTSRFRQRSKPCRREYRQYCTNATRIRRRATTVAKVATTGQSRKATADPHPTHHVVTAVS